MRKRLAMVTSEVISLLGANMKFATIVTMTLPQAESDTDLFRDYRQQLENGLISYSAGFPQYPRNFSRDTINAGIIASDADLLLSQLEVSAYYQGRANDSRTGERSGKIHHEFPGVIVNDSDRYSTYNACDTTALFLIAVEGLMQLDGVAATSFIEQKTETIKRAVSYLLDSIGKDDLFWELPPSGNDGYALRVTYWKDSILPNSGGKTEPVYPVVFSQAHFIVARGLLSASRILHNTSLATKADRMYIAGIEEFIRPDGYTVYRDREGELRQASSDELHALAYIPKSYARMLPINAIRQRAKLLITPFGFLCTPEHVAVRLSDTYHGDKVWVFEQAMIHYGATKFGLIDEAKIAASVSEYIGEGQELFGIGHDKEGHMIPIPEGNDRQLWSVATRAYFTHRTMLLEKQWL